MRQGRETEAGLGSIMLTMFFKMISTDHAQIYEDRYVCIKP